MQEETLGQRIKRLRELRRWKQWELADALEVSAKTISNWESGRNDPRSSMGALRKLFGDAIDAGPVPEEDNDPVKVAVFTSELTRDRAHQVYGYYLAHLREQREEAAG